MKRWCGRCTVMVLGLCIGAEAGALSLSELRQPDLAGRSMTLTELHRSPQTPGQVRVTSAQECDVLIKFQTQKRVRALTVHAVDAPQALRILKQRSDVEFAEFDQQLVRQFEPADPLNVNQWHHETIGSTNGWDWSTGVSDVKVAIVDLPFNMEHADLAANAVQGWDVVNLVPVSAGDDLHSTMCAGMAGAVVDNGVGIAGVGNFTLVPINNASGLSASVSDTASAIYWAADHGVRVVSISWSGADSDVLNSAAEYLRNTNEGVVVMAGINGTGFLDYTNQPCIVAVSMTDRSDNLQSHYGPHIDFSAPGYAIYSTSVSGYTTGNGTSYATPLVAGIFASLFSINPALSAEDAVSILKATALDLGDSGRDDYYGWGRVDFGRAAWLAAATAELVDNLGDVQMEEGSPDLTVSAEYRPGVSYTLMGSASLDAPDWYRVAATVQTNENRIEFSVEPTVDAGFYKVTGTVNLQ